MRRTVFFSILSLFLAFYLTSCSWSVNLIVANNSSQDILVRYFIPADTIAYPRFYKDPKTYLYNSDLLKLSKLNASKRPPTIQGSIITLPQTMQLEIRLAPGQAVHVGHYASYESRAEVILKNNLTVIKSDSTLTSAQVNNRFRHWKNINTDLLEIN